MHQQLVIQLVDNCISGVVTFPCAEIYLFKPRPECSHYFVHFCRTTQKSSGIRPNSFIPQTEKNVVIRVDIHQALLGKFGECQPWLFYLKVKGCKSELTKKLLFCRSTASLWTAKTNIKTILNCIDYN